MSTNTLPGPGGYLIFKPRYGRDPLASFEADWRAHGDLFSSKVVPGYRILFAVHPDAVERILRTHQSRYPKARNITKALSLALGGGIVTSEGDRWRRQRRMMQPTFHQEALNAFLPIMARQASTFSESLARRGPGTALDVTDAMQRLTLTILGECMFGPLDAEQTERFSRVFRGVAQFIDDRVTSPLHAPLWMPTPKHLRYRRDKRVLDEIALELVRRRRAQGDDGPPDLLWAMIRARDEDSGAGFDDEELRDQIITLLVAGHETVSVTLSWAIHRLTQQPETLARLQDEVSFLTGPVTPADLPKLGYATQVIRETLRLYPPVWSIPREAAEDDELDGYAVRKGTLVFVGTMFTHQHPEFWDAPQSFDPDRFEEAQIAKRHPYAWYPFGAGPRACIGEAFALQEATLILASLAARLDLKAASTGLISPDPTFTLRPKGGLRVLVSPRH